LKPGCYHLKKQPIGCVAQLSSEGDFQRGFGGTNVGKCPGRNYLGQNVWGGEMTQGVTDSTRLAILLAVKTVVMLS